MKPHIRASFLALLAASLAACTTPTGDPDRRGSGAILGAATGAAVGNLIGGDSRGTLIGATTGALLGAKVGNQLDRQAAELEQSLAGSGAGITNTGSQLVVSLPESITFATGSATVRQDFSDELLVVSRNLQAYPNTTVQVIGHTDNVGSADYNQGLSERRAAAVADVLIGAGTPSWRILTRGVGFSQPIATNETEAGRAANRRVEIVITPQA